MKTGTTVGEILLRLSTVCNSSDVFSVECLKARGNYASFKLTWSLVEKVMVPEMWYQGVCIKPGTLIFRRYHGREMKEPKLRCLGVKTKASINCLLSECAMVQI